MRQSVFFASAMMMAVVGLADSPAVRSAQESVAVSSSTSTPFVFKSIKNDAFGVGEKLVFAIKYQFIGAGTASMEVKPAGPVNGRTAWQIESVAASNKMVDAFFKVRDINSSIVDSESLMSYNFHQNLREGKYKVMRTTVFDYSNKRFVFEKIRKGKLTQRDGPLSGPVMDVLGAFFYVRTLDLRPGDELAVTVFTDEESYPLVVKVHPKIHKISVPAGKFQCLRIDPRVKGDAIFRVEDGNMEIYLTNDKHKMPVLIRSRVFIGSFDAELISVKHSDALAFDRPEMK